MDVFNIVLRLLMICLPWVFVAVCFKTMNKKDKEDALIEEPLGCFRTPTESEVIRVKEALLPSRAKSMVTANIIMLLIDAFFIYSFVYQRNEEADMGRIISMGLMAFAAVAVHIVVVISQYGLYRDVARENFTVSDAHIIDVNVYTRRKGFIASEYCTLLLKRPDGIEEEYALPKGERYESVPIGSKCLIVRNGYEDRINKNRSRGRYVKSRSVVL